MVNCSNLIIKMSPRFVLGRENVPCVAEVVNRSLKADCTDFIRNDSTHPRYESKFCFVGNGSVLLMAGVREWHLGRVLSIVERGRQNSLFPVVCHVPG